MHNILVLTLSVCKHHETFSFMMSLPGISFGDKFCFSRKGGIGDGGRTWSKQHAAKNN